MLSFISRIAIVVGFIAATTFYLLHKGYENCKKDWQISDAAKEEAARQENEKAHDFQRKLINKNNFSNSSDSHIKWLHAIYQERKSNSD